MQTKQADGAERAHWRLISEGAQALSNRELLAVFLRIGVTDSAALAQSEALIGQFGSLNALFAASLPQFSCVRGVGPGKFAQLQAVLELARRALGEQLAQGLALSSPDAVRQYLRMTLSKKDHEIFVVLFLDVKNRLLACEEMFRGTLTHTSVYPREVLKAALAHNAAGVILAHNHPSGASEPSESDVRLTRALVQALALVDIRVLDHFVVAGPHVHSFAEHGQM